MATKFEVDAALAKLSVALEAAERQFAPLRVERAKLAADLVELRKLIAHEAERSGLKKLTFPKEHT